MGVFSRVSGDRRGPALVALTLLGALVPLWWAAQGPLAARDFGIIWTAGSNVLHGLSPYASSPPYAYPPQALLIAAPLALLPVSVAFVLWNALSLGLFYFAARPWLPKGFPPVQAILTPASLFCVAFGQTGLFVGALWLFAFRGSSIAAATLSMKPQLGFLIVPRLFRDRRLLVRSVVALAVLLAVSTLLIGYWPEFVQRALIHSRQTADNNWLAWYRLGVTPLIGYGILGWALYGTAAAYFLSRDYNVWTAATATFLVSPYGFNYDLPVVCLGLAVLIWNRWESMNALQRLICCVGFLSPLIVLGGTWFAPPILLACLWLQTRSEERLLSARHSPNPSYSELRPS